MEVKFFKNLGLCSFSALLLITSFPKWNAGYFAWGAFVPLFWILVNQKLTHGFFWGLAWGVLFFLGIFDWILEIPYYRWYHHGLLALYLGSYIGLFGLGVSFLNKRLGRSWALWSTPFLWVVLEYIRGSFSFLALPWGFVAHSQYQYPFVIQSVSVVGTYGLSFLMILANAGIATLMFQIFAFWKSEEKKKKDIAGTALIFLSSLCMIFIFLYGYRIDGKPSGGSPLSVSLIQGNIEQWKKWNSAYADEILSVYTDLSLQASHTQPDLIVWPETAAPGSVQGDDTLLTRLTSLAQKTGIPILLGSAKYQKFQEAEDIGVRLTNSAFLFGISDKMPRLQHYDKIRLFPFGEYLPYKALLPWTWIHVSSLGDYVPGREYTLFQLLPHRFAVTICWENIFPDLVRRFVDHGAQFIINITNEARFGDTAAPYQLMAISVFRAVENGVFVLRCANTGVSGIIDPHGRIIQTLQDARGQETFVRGFLTGKVVPTQTKTFYTEHGDLVPFGSAAGCGLFLLLALKRPGMEKNGRKSGRC